MTNGTIVVTIEVAIQEGEEDMLSFFVETPEGKWVNFTTLSDNNLIEFLYGSFSTISGNGVTILGNQLLTSDFINFDLLSNYIPLSLTGYISFVNGMFTVTGNAGEFGYSADGKNWKYIDEGVTGEVLSAFFYDGEYIINALASPYFSPPQVYTSEYGESWEAQSDIELFYLHYDAELDQLVGYDVNNDIYYGESLDTIMSNKIAGPAPLGEGSISYGENMWVVTTCNRVPGMHPKYESVIWSMKDDETSWSEGWANESPDGALIWEAVYFDGSFFVSGVNGLLVSNDGMQWKGASAPPSNPTSFAVIFDMLYAFTESNEVYVSESASSSNWQLVDDGTPFTALAESGQWVIGTTPGKFYYSIGGIEFQEGNPITSEDITFNFIQTGINTWLAVGTDNDPYSFNNIIYSGVLD